MKLNIKQITVGVIAVSNLLSFTLTAFATQNIVIEKEFETQTKDFNYAFDNEIIQDGKTYILNQNNVKYEVISQTTDTPALSEKVIKENLKTKNDSVFESEFIKDGNKFTLQDITWENTVGENRFANASGNLTFADLTSPPTPPQTYSFTYTDTDNNNEVIPVNLTLANLTDSGFTCKNDFSVEVEVIDYDAPYYKFNDNLIPKKEEFPLLIGYENDYLNHLNLNSNSYTLNASEWAGEPYTDSDGIVKRKAKFTGSRYVADFTANYQNTLELPSLDEFTATAIYNFENTSNSVTAYKVKATATYDQVNDNFLFTVLTISLITIILCLLVIGLIFLLKNKSKSEV